MGDLGHEPGSIGSELIAGLPGAALAQSVMVQGSGALEFGGEEPGTSALSGGVSRPRKVSPFLEDPGVRVLPTGYTRQINNRNRDCDRAP